MAATAAYGLLAALGALVCAAAGSMYAVQALQARTQVSRVQHRAGGGSLARRVVRNGIRSLDEVQGRLRQVPLWGAWCDRVSQVLVSRGVHTSSRAVGTIAAAGCLLCLAVGSVAGSPVAGAAVPAVAMFAVWSRASRAVERRRDAVRDALPDAMRTMSACFHVGFTLQQTFAQLAQEAASPLDEVFEQASNELVTGATANEALERVRTRGDVAELSFLAVALEVQHQSGGSMQHVLNATSESLDSELELRRSLRVQTAQARLSARVVVGVSLAMVAALSLLSQDFLAPFFSSVLGMGVLALAVIMQVAGIMLVRRMLNVEVD